VVLSASKCVTILQKEENKVGNWKIFMLYHAHLVTAQSMANWGSSVYYCSSIWFWFPILLLLCVHVWLCLLHLKLVLT